MIKVGDEAPDILMNIGDEKTAKISDFKGKKVILYFYSKDNTSGCTSEACDFRDNQELFDDADAVVIGVSKDSLESHKKFRDKNNLKFILASDSNLELIQAYDVWKEKNMYGKKAMGVERSTFIIDEEGIVRKIYNKVKVKGHVDQVLKDLKEL